MGALLSGFLTGLNQQADSLQPSDASRLGTVLLDLLPSCSAQILDDESALSPEARDRVTVMRIRAFVRQNLHDPELTSPVVAAAHYISLSYAHRLFQEQMSRRYTPSPPTGVFLAPPDFTRALRTAYGPPRSTALAARERAPVDAEPSISRLTGNDSLRTHPAS